MSRVRHVLKDLSIAEAQRRRKCHHNAKHQILQGQLCMEVRNPNGEGHKNYCLTCALEILDAASDDVDRLRTKLA